MLVVSVATLVELAEKSLNIERLGILAVDGGAAASNPLLQAQADSTGLKVKRPANLESTAKGAALMAGVQSGAIPNISTLVKNKEKGGPICEGEIWHRCIHKEYQRSLFGESGKIGGFVLQRYSLSGRRKMEMFN